GARVRDLTVDPANERVLVVLEAEVGWQDPFCEKGTSTALGSLVLALDGEGRRLYDRYLGTDPAGPPAELRSCPPACGVEAFTAFLPRGLAVTEQGGVEVGGERVGALEAGGRRTPFRHRFTADLEPQDGLENRSQVLESCALSGHVVSIAAMADSTWTGSLSDVWAADGCTGSLILTPDMNTTSYQHGFEAQLSPPPLPIPATVRLRFKIENGLPADAEILLRRLSDGVFVAVGTLHSTGTLIDGEILVADATPYRNGTVNMTVRAIITYSGPAAGCQDSEIDYIDDDR
ncbi:MAG: hypothetical protein KDD47_19685, partial [Acidobacteria bacterium]|nr:hypothetical protein [Acidobacteriota bacterium]